MKQNSIYENNLQMMEMLLEIQKKSMRLYVICAVLPVFIGIAVIIIGQGFTTNEILNKITSSGGAFIVTIGGFSIKEYLSKKDNINILKKLKLKIEFCKGNNIDQKNFNSLINGMLIKKL